jgi:hypothetical protein
MPIAALQSYLEAEAGLKASTTNLLAQESPSLLNTDHASEYAQILDEKAR